MPAFSSHYIFAKELMPFIKENADFTVNEGAVLFGTQGPDIFFSHRALPWMIGKTLRKTGSLLHRTKPEITVNAMIDYANASPNKDIAKSYLYGFILHYALDRKCHPFVYAKQNEIIRKKPYLNGHSVHNTIEFSADVYLLNKRMKIKKPHLFDTCSTVPTDKTVIDEIGRMWEYVLPRATGKKITQKQAITALVDEKKIQKYTTDKSGFKRILLSPIETIAAPLTKNYKITSFIRPRDLEKAKKYVNIENSKWVSPYGIESADSFEQLFDKAKEEAKQMLLLLKDGATGAEITGNLSFLTGVEVK